VQKGALEKMEDNELDAEREKLSKTIAKYRQRVTLQKMKLDDLQAQLKDKSKTLGEIRKRAHETEHRVRLAKPSNKSIATLEKKLEKEYHNLNETKATARVERAKIDELRTQLTGKKAYRRKLLSRLSKVEEKEKEAQEDMEEAINYKESLIKSVKEYKQLINKERNAFRFVEVQQMHQLEHETLSPKPQAPTNTNNKKIKPSAKRIIEQKLMTSGGPKGADALNLNVKRAVAQRIASQVSTKEDAFNMIKRKTGIENLDEIVSEFIRCQEREFDIYTQIQHLSFELKALEDENKKLLAECAKYKGEGASAEEQKKQRIANLNKEIQDAQSKAEEYEEMAVNGNHVVNTVMPIIGKLMYLVQGEHSERRNSNRLINRYISSVYREKIQEHEYSEIGPTLGVLESRLSDLVHLFYVLAKSKNLTRNGGTNGDVTGASGFDGSIHDYNLNSLVASGNDALQMPSLQKKGTASKKGGKSLGKQKDFTKKVGIKGSQLLAELPSTTSTKSSHDENDPSDHYEMDEELELKPQTIETFFHEIKKQYAMDHDESSHKANHSKKR